MSEKRFELFGNNYLALDDNVEEKTYYLNDDESIDLLVAKMNSLAEGNELLKQTNEKLAIENANLEQNIRFITPLIGKQSKEMNELAEKNKQLQEENKKLQKKLNEVDTYFEELNKISIRKIELLRKLIKEVREE